MSLKSYFLALKKYLCEIYLNFGGARQFLNGPLTLTNTFSYAEEDHKFSRVIRDRKTPKEERLCHPNSDIFVNEEGQRFCFKRPDDPTERVGEMQYKVKCKSADESSGTTAITGTTASTETTASTDSTVSSGTADDDRGKGNFKFTIF